MPGIVGLITHRNAGWATAQLTRMMETMRHESSYNSYVHTDESLGVYVGSISRRGSFADAPPAQNERADVTLIFSGEEFSEPEIAAELRHRGHTFTNQAPSYLVHLYEDDDAAFAGRLNGRFHGLIADRRNGTAMLFNDRFGMHRIYYHESSEAFYFAAEAKAILEVCPELRVADPQALGEFISCGCVLENRTYFKGIQVVPRLPRGSFEAVRWRAKASTSVAKNGKTRSRLSPKSTTNRCGKSLRAIYLGTSAATRPSECP